MGGDFTAGTPGGVGTAPSWKRAFGFRTSRPPTVPTVEYYGRPRSRPLFWEWTMESGKDRVGSLGRPLF